MLIYFHQLNQMVIELRCEWQEYRKLERGFRRNV